nr:hypothetical protein GCM10020093_010600 [Planobispora longispora]
MPYGGQGPRRQDAQRNRLAIIQAAVSMMSDPRSLGVMPEIARRAGVGQATLYRHFPDRNALADAVIAYGYHGWKPAPAIPTIRWPSGTCSGRCCARR